MFKKALTYILIFTLAICMFIGCTDSNSGHIDTPSTESYVLQFFENIQDNDVIPFTITEKARTTLNEMGNLFLSNSNEGLDELTDITLEYKVLTKNIDKHGDKLMYFPEAYVLSIDETILDEETTISELHLMDADENSYYVISLSAYDNIFEGDIVTAYALPIGESSFENIGGGTTLAIVLVGCYIEKIPY